MGNRERRAQRQRAALADASDLWAFSGIVRGVGLGVLLWAVVLWAVR